MIDPALLPFIEASDAFYPADTASRPLTAQRALYDAYARAFAVERPASVVSEDATLNAEGRAVGLRLYRPGVRKTGGLILYAHGGGFILGSLDSHDGIVARVAAETGTNVVAIDYRLAPEHPAPAPFEDGIAVVEAALAGTLPGCDGVPSGLALMGDSAGGTLMASVALTIGGRRPGALAALGLVYPMLGFEPAAPACHTEANAPMLTLADVRFYRSQLLGGRPCPPGCLVLDEPDLTGLPPTVLLPAEHDPLRDDCTVLHDRLSALGTETLLLPGTGLVHGCLRALDRTEVVAGPFGEMTDFLRRHLG